MLNCKGGMTAGKYTIIAQVIDGMDVLDKMEKIKVGKLKLCRSKQSSLRHLQAWHVSQLSIACIM